MASVTSVTAEPTAIARAGTSTITPKISDPSTIATVTVTVDGATGSAPVEIHETLVYSVNPEDKTKAGHVVATVSEGGTIAVAASGTAFTFTAS